MWIASSVRNRLEYIEMSCYELSHSIVICYVSSIHYFCLYFLFLEHTGEPHVNILRR
jgi:hypothetical protein